MTIQELLRKEWDFVPLPLPRMDVQVLAPECEHGVRVVLFEGNARLARMIAAVPRVVSELTMARDFIAQAAEEAPHDAVLDAKLKAIDEALALVGATGKLDR